MLVRTLVRVPLFITAAVFCHPALAHTGPSAATLKSLNVFPSRVSLNGPRASQRMGVLGQYADGRLCDLTREAKFATNAPSVARVEAGIISAAGDGTAVITIEYQGCAASVPVHVSGATVDRPVDFSREVLPALTKAGCNQGACHGGQHGKGGFRLSLLGYDPAFDYSQIVQSAEGRRVVLSDPERSILLLKPTLTMEHGGGERFTVNSRTYSILKRWLEDGAPEPTTKDAEVTSLTVWPSRRIMKIGEQQQIIVQASSSDGRTEDVTAIAQYDSLNDSVAAVVPSGLITARARGETYIMVRFRGQATVAQVTLPYGAPAATASFSKFNFVDGRLAAKWRQLGLTPSPSCTDEEFLRRIYLDAAGVLPAPADVKAFLANRNPDKRRQAVDRVLERPEFVDFWALKWGDLLRINRDQLSEKGMWSFYNWVRGELRDNKPVDEFVRDIITAEGSTFTEGPANYYRVANNAADWAENTAQLFLGVRMQCARCHHHPFEKWSQEDYYSMAAFFVRLGTKRSQEFGIFGQETVVYLRSAGEQTLPKKGTVVKPRPPDGPAMDDPFDRRRKLAEWLTAKDNPFFARNMVNRVWGYFMGRGLVEPLDDMRATNPATNPDLLDALAKDFAEQRFDLKHLMRTIMNSHGYQLSSTATAGNEADVNNVFFTHYTVKRLTAEQLADALDAVTGTREKYQGLPLGTRAAQLPDTAIRSFFLDVFGRPPRQVTCECERGTQPNIAQALHLLNGDILNRKINAPEGRLEKLLKAKTPMPEVVREMYLTTLARMPKPDELKNAQAWVAQAPSQKEGVQDLLWSLLNSREFLFNH